MPDVRIERVRGAILYSMPTASDVLKAAQRPALGLSLQLWAFSRWIFRYWTGGIASALRDQLDFIWAGQFDFRPESCFEHSAHAQGLPDQIAKMKPGGLKYLDVALQYCDRQRA